MTNNNDKKVLKSSVEREQSESVSSAGCEKIKGSKNLNVPALRFPEFSGEWGKYTLGDIGDTYNGLTGKSAVDFGSGSPFITYKSIFDNSKIDVSKIEYVRITDAERAKQTQNEVKYGDIFFTTSSETPNEVGMASVLLTDISDCYLNSFCFGYRIIDKVAYRPEFFRFYLHSNKVRRNIAILAQGSTRFNISKNEVMRVPINLPEYAEQRKVAQFLSLIEERISTQNKIIEKYESLIQGIIETVISSQKPNTLIKNCLECYSSTLQENQIAGNGDYPVYGATGISGYTETADVNGESILVIKDGSSVGTVMFVDGEYSYIGTLNRLIAKKGYCLKYLYFTLQGFSFEPYKTGMAIPHIYFKDYSKAKIYCPPIRQQTFIAQQLSFLENKIDVEKLMLLCLQKKKNYLLSRMFI